MDKTEAYSYLFMDSFMGALILPPDTELVFDVMRIFGGYDPLWMWVLAVIGSSVGASVNWGLGRMLLTCEKQQWFVQHTPQLDRVSTIAKRYAWFLLLCSWVPIIGTVSMLPFGVFRMRYHWFLLLILAGRAAYYGGALYFS